MSPVSAEAGAAPAAARIGRGRSILVGVLLIVAGLVAMAFPFLSSIAVTVMVGWLLVFAGAIKIMHAIGLRGWRGAVWYGLVGVVFLIGGGLLLAAPLAATFSLTALLAAILIVEGVLEIVAAVAMRDRTSWGWVLASGIVALVAGIAITTQLPASASWVLGVVFGLNLIFSGASYLMDPYDDVAVTAPPR
ncbi:MAG: HdeD family acid-resistance protein [Hyphomicrobiaceae bacterium]